MGVTGLFMRDKSASWQAKATADQICEENLVLSKSG